MVDSQLGRALYFLLAIIFRIEPRALAASTVFERETVTRLAPAAQIFAFTVWLKPFGSSTLIPE